MKSENWLILLIYTHISVRVFIISYQANNIQRQFGYLLLPSPKLPPHIHRHKKHQCREKRRTETVLTKIVNDKSLDAEKVQRHQKADDRGGEDGGRGFIFS